jgi:hypothetical protein
MKKNKFKRGWSEDLAQTYLYDGETLQFEDGIEYTMKEALLLSSGDPIKSEVLAVHRTKKLFNGEIIGFSKAEKTVLPSAHPSREPSSVYLQLSLFDKGKRIEA